MIQKLLILFAALALSVCLLTGCGEDNKTDSDTTTVAETQVTTVETTKATKATNEQKKELINVLFND